MSQLTARQKHDILVHCASRHDGESEVEIARLHGASVTRQTIYNWRCHWNGTPESLEHAQVTGRPRILTPAEISRHIHAPILAANRAHRSISYPQLRDRVEEKTSKSISLRTVQQIGKEQLGARYQHTVKRTEEEGE